MARQIPCTCIKSPRCIAESPGMLPGSARDGYASHSAATLASWWCIVMQDGGAAGEPGSLFQTALSEGECSRIEGVDAGVKIERVGAAAGKVGARVEVQSSRARL